MRVIAKPGVELWDRVVAQSPDSTFFHTSTWAQVLTNTYPHFQAATKAFILDDGAVAVVPMLATVERNRYFRWCESMYPGGYGGIVAERSLAASEIGAICRLLPDSRTAYLHIMQNPGTAQDWPAPYTRSAQYTHVLSLSDDFDLIFSRYSPEKRRHVRKAAKLGVEVGLAEAEADYRAYYVVYEDTLRRWGSSALMRYPYRLFEELHRHRGAEIRLWVARVEGQIVSGSVVLYHHGTAIYWHGATHEDYFSQHPAPFLMNEVIRDACRRGFTCFDLGASGGVDGVEHYKEGFGAKKLEFGSYVWRANRLYRAYQQLHDGLRWRASGKPAAHRPELQPVPKAAAERPEGVES